MRKLFTLLFAATSLIANAQLSDLFLNDLQAPDSIEPNNYLFNMPGLNKVDVFNYTNTPVTGVYKNSLYLSKDMILDASDLEIVQTQGASVGIQTNYTETYGAMNFSKDIGNTFPAGTNYLIFKTDSYNEIAESNENNNTIVRPIRVIAFPDITLKILTASTSLKITQPNLTTPLTVELKNIGPGSASNVVLSVVLSNSGSIYQTIIMDTIPLLASNGTIIKTYNTIKLDSNFVSGTYTLIANAGIYPQKELINSNNGENRTGIVVAAASNLVFTNITGPNNVKPGNTYTYTFTVQNTGGLATNLDSAFFYQNTYIPAFKGPSGNYLNKRSNGIAIGTLLPGQSKTITGTWNIDPNFIVGSIYNYNGYNSPNNTGTTYIGSKDARYLTFYDANTFYNANLYAIAPIYPSGELSLTVTSPSITYQPDGKVKVKIEISNAGPETLKNTSAVFGWKESGSYLPSVDTSINCSLLSNYAFGSYYQSIYVPTLAPNQKASITLSFTLANGLVPLSNVSTFTSYISQSFCATNTNKLNDTSIIALTLQGNVDYCTSKSAFPWEQWIEKVTLTNIKQPYTNLSSKDQYSFFNPTSPAKLELGAAPFLTIYPQSSWQGNPQNASMYFRAWIDFNGDKFFDPYTEIIANDQVRYENGVLLFTERFFTVPLNAKLGKTRMRIQMSQGSYFNPCQNFDRGEVEDYTVEIVDGNADPCATDATNPIFTNCPANITLSTSSTSAIATWTAPTASDNCGTPAVTSTANSGSSFNVGTTVVTYTATDAKGNKGFCNFNVTVNKIVDPCSIDVTAPTISGCPSNINLTTNGTCATTTWTAPTATDNCGIPTLSQISGTASGSCFPIGKNVITYKATDAKGNFNTCTFNVEVLKNVFNNKEDLEVSIVSSVSNPAIYSNVNFTVTVKNNSTVASGKFRINMNTCTGGVIKTFIQNPGMLVYAGKPTIASVGVYDEVNQTWTINTLAAGASATYIIKAFTLTSKEVTMTAFVDQQTNSDFDSNPSTTLASCIPSQDDESAVIINKGSTRESNNSFDINHTIMVFPNPAGELLNVNITKWEKQSVEINIYNMLGVQLSQISLDENHTPIHTIDISELKDGNYFLFLSSKNTKSEALKFVKHQSH